MRAAAIRGLVEAATANCASELLAAVQDKDSLVRRAAADSLEQIYDPRKRYTEMRTARAAAASRRKTLRRRSSFSFADLMHPADLLQRLR